MAVARRARRLGSEQGSVTVVAAGILVALAVLAMGSADLVRVLLAAARAQTAADAAALAAVQSQAFPTGLEPEPAAEELALRNDAELLTCACDPGTFEARVEVRAPVGELFLASDGLSVRASARAVVEVPQWSSSP